jgi:hypothetical protein
MGEKSSSDERPSSGREFKEIFDYLFGSETDIRKAIPVSGVRRLGWGWAFLIAYYYSRLYPRFSEVDEEDKMIKPSFARFVKAVETEDEESREDAEVYLRWTILLEKFFPIVASMSPQAHMNADRLVNKFSMPQVEYLIRETNEARKPFWREYVGIEAEPRKTQRPKLPRIFSFEG